MCVTRIKLELCIFHADNTKVAQYLYNLWMETIEKYEAKNIMAIVTYGAEVNKAAATRVIQK